MLRRFLRPALYTLAIPLFAPTLAAVPGGWLTAVLGIGFLIFIHEWGHYMACVLTKTRTEAFSVGFGPRLLGWERDRDGKRRFTVGRRQLDPEDHAMDFRIALVPLGGYVKMAGGEIIGESQTEDPAMFVNKSAWARIFIISAGVIMNLITAVVFYSLSYVANKEHEPNVIGQVVPGGPAWAAELRPGDEVIEINGSAVRTFYDLRMEVVFLDDDERATFTVLRDGKQRIVSVLPEYVEDAGHQQIQIGPGSALTIGTGDAALEIGFTDDATVQGIPARGGADVRSRIVGALGAGQTRIVVESASGATTTLDVAALDRSIEPAGSPPPSKVGVEPYARARVKNVRVGDGYLKLGDVLLAAETAGGRVHLDSGSAFDQILFMAPVTGFVVKRAEAELTIDVALATPTAVAGWLDAHAFELKPTNRVVPIEAGRYHVFVRDLYRYPSSPATEAGVRHGDAVVKIGDREIASFDALRDAVGGATAGEELLFVLEDELGVRRTVPVVPVTLERVGALAMEETRRIPLDVTLGVAFQMGSKNTFREVANVFRTIGALFTGRLSFQKNIAGPARLVEFSKAQADRGVAELLWFLAYVSVMLAVLNILPIPVLDGGHLLFIIIEKIKGSPLKEATVAKAMYIGLFLVLTLMFFAFKSDWNHFFG